MVVLGCHKHVAIKRCNLLRPSLGVIMRVLTHDGRNGFVEEGEIEILDVDKFKLGIATFLRDFVSPFGHCLAFATRSRASDNYRNSKHELLYCRGRSRLSELAGL